MKTREEKSEFLRAYAHSYIKEEIVAEQLVRKLQPFRDFLEIAAQCNGQILNFTRIAKEVGADVKTIQSYFEILEIHRLNTYERKDWRLSYLRTKDDAEIDLIIERPGMPRALVEIKSKDRITEADTVHLNRLAPDIQKSEAFCLSRDPIKKRIGSTLCLPWQEGLRELGMVGRFM